jgi:hypothetical protein
VTFSAETTVTASTASEAIRKAEALGATEITSISRV